MIVESVSKHPKEDRVAQEPRVIDKATANFMRSLCMGQIEEEIILPFPELSQADKETLEGVFTTLGQLFGPREADLKAWDKKGEFPLEFIDKIREAGLFSFVVPEEHGGLGFGSKAYSRALQEVAKYDASVAVTIGAHSSIGMRGLLLFGNEEQRSRYYAKLASGELIAAFCLTEPSSGSDAASIKTTAVRDGDHYVMNGTKIWITNGGIADFFTIFAKTGDPKDRRHLSAFIVTRDMPGVTTGPHEDKMGIRASSTTTVNLENVRVPVANLLGEEGKGFKVAMNILNSGRTGLGGSSRFRRPRRTSAFSSTSPSASSASSSKRSGRWSSTVTPPKPPSRSSPGSWTRVTPTTPSKPPSARCSRAKRSGALPTRRSRSRRATAT
jgi:acyl-CoA dehydrogenase family protein 9